MKPKDAKEYVFNDLLGMQSYCRNHYEQYYSTSDFSCNITQLSKGELLTSSICAPINNVHLEIFKSNQTLLYEEEANYNSVAFGASIGAKAASAPGSGDTVIAGRMTFDTGTATGGTTQTQMEIREDGHLMLRRGRVNNNKKSVIFFAM